MRPLYSLLIAATLLLPAAGITQVTVSQAWAVNDGQSITSFPPVGAFTDASGNCYVLGSNNSGSGISDFVTLKYNSAGALQWINTYNDPFNSEDDAYTGAIDNAGNIYICGTSYYTVNGAINGVLTTIKYSSAGSQLWISSLDISNDAIPSAMVIDQTGNVYITGSIPQFFTVKLNSSGVEQWEQTYSSSNYNTAENNSIALDPSGNIYVTGQAVGSELIFRIREPPLIISTGADFITIKYSPAGVQQWVARYNGSGNTNDYPHAIAVDASGNSYVTGQSGNYGFTIAYNTNGGTLWSDLNTAVTNNSAIALDPSGNIVAAGYLLSNPTITYVLKKYTPAGAESWLSTYFGNAYTSSQPYHFGFGQNVALAIDGAGNCYIAGTKGSTTDPSTATSDWVTAAFNSSGGYEWAEIYSDPFYTNDVPSHIAIVNPTSPLITAMASVYVVGVNNYLNGSQGEYTAVKYNQARRLLILDPLADQSATQTDSSLGFGATLRPGLSNYPNPFHGMTNITYTLSNDSHVILQVFDAAGKTIATLLNDDEPAGQHVLPFYSARLAAGIYEYHIIATSPQGNYTATRQMIVH
jgi:hypothetical protein